MALFSGILDAPQTYYSATSPWPEPPLGAGQAIDDRVADVAIVGGGDGGVQAHDHALVASN